MSFLAKLRTLGGKWEYDRENQSYEGYFAGEYPGYRRGLRINFSHEYPVVIWMNGTALRGRDIDSEDKLFQVLRDEIGTITGK